VRLLDLSRLDRHRRTNHMAIIIGLVIGALVGWLIGKNKGLGGLGLILGGLLGVIGWIIVAVMKGNPDANQPPR
jgi:F0F1-type ATP synthase assembly protein I